MKQSISVEIKKIGNTIEEWWTSKNPFVFEENRDISNTINYMVQRNSLLAFYKQIESVAIQNGRYNKYEYDASVKLPPAFKESKRTYSFEYVPSGGKKTCTKCSHYKTYKNNDYCILRGQKLNSNYWHKCVYWLENPNWPNGSINGDLHKQKRSRKDGSDSS